MSGSGGPVKRARGALLLVVLAGLAATGCGAARAPAADRIEGRTLTIYSSTPFQGASALGAQAVLNGELMALERVHAQIGRYRLVFKVLDDSTPQGGGWDPGQTTANARLAVSDPTTIGYVGEFNSGGSAISIPILNRAGIPQLSASDTAVGLTSSVPGASPGEPGKYYPTGVRTFARVVPNDTVQAAAQVRLQQAAGCAKSFVLDDEDVDGADTASTFQLAARAAGLPVAGVEGFDSRAGDYTALAAGVARTGADCVLISADTENHAVLLTEQVAAALPHAKLFGTAGLAESTFTDESQGGVPVALDHRLLITVASVNGASYRAAGRTFLAAYARRYGPPEPYAIFGYEAMTLLLDAISRATRHGTEPAERSKVRAVIFATRDRNSVLGTYSIDLSGDTTLRWYGAYRVVGGRLRLWRVLAG